MNGRQPGRAPGASHLSVREAAAYLDGALSPDDQARLEEHLADCERCRDEVVDAARVLETVGRSGRTRRWAVGAATAAAVVVLAVVALDTGLTGTDPAPGRQLRDGAPTPAESLRRIEAVRPGPGERAEVAGLRFVWRSTGRDALYRLTVSRPDGEVVATTSTGDTTVEAATFSGLERGERYFWYVDALFRDGRTASTGVRSFVVAP